MKTCPLLGTECIKNQCIAWAKLEDVDPVTGQKLGTFTSSFCAFFRGQ